MTDSLITSQAKRCAKAFRQMAENSDPQRSILVKLPLENLKDLPGGE